MRTGPIVDLAGNPIEREVEPTDAFEPVKVEFNTTDEWLKYRVNTIGGSEAAAVLGVHQFKSAYALWCEKAGLIEPEDLTDNDPVIFGRLVEPVIAELYERKTKRKLIDHGLHIFRHPTLPISVSVDREIEPIDSRGPGLLEMKSTEKFSYKDLQQEIPIDWQIQISHGLGVTRLKWASLAILIHRKLYYLDIERNDEFIELLFQKELEFWKRIEELRPPPVDSAESTMDAIKRAYPFDTGTCVDLPPEAIDWDQQIQHAKDEIKHWQAIQDENENKIKAALETASFGKFGDLEYSWKLQRRKSYTVKEAEFRVLRRLK